MSEKKKLKEINPPFESVEFSPEEIATIAIMFIQGLRALLRDAPKSRRYRLEMKMFEVKRVRKHENP